MKETETILEAETFWGCSIEELDAEGVACWEMERAAYPAEQRQEMREASRNSGNWDSIEAVAAKAFDGWHKLGPQSAQY